jgi:hypothetical protein
MPPTDVAGPSASSNQGRTGVSIRPALNPGNVVPRNDLDAVEYVDKEDLVLRVGEAASAPRLRMVERPAFSPNVEKRKRRRGDSATHQRGRSRFGTITYDPTIEGQHGRRIHLHLAVDGRRYYPPLPAIGSLRAPTRTESEPRSRCDSRPRCSLRRSPAGELPGPSTASTASRPSTRGRVNLTAVATGPAPLAAGINRFR